MEQAFEWYRKAAKQGNAKAQNNLGIFYTAGGGVTNDPVQAVEWHRRAAEQGIANAQHLLGDCYKYGCGVEKNN